MSLFYDHLPLQPDHLWPGYFCQVRWSRKYGEWQVIQHRYSNVSHPGLYFPAFSGKTAEQKAQEDAEWERMADRMCYDVEWSDDGELEEEEWDHLSPQRDDDASSLYAHPGSIFKRNRCEPDRIETPIAPWDRCSTPTITLLASSGPNVPTITLTEENRCWQPWYPQSSRNIKSHIIPWSYTESGEDMSAVYWDTTQICWAKGTSSFFQPYAAHGHTAAELHVFKLNTTRQGWVDEERLVEATFETVWPLLPSENDDSRINYRYHLVTSASSTPPTSPTSSAILSPTTSTSGLTASTSATSFDDIYDDVWGTKTIKEPSPPTSLITMPKASIRTTPAIEGYGLDQSLPRHDTRSIHKKLYQVSHPVLPLLSLQLTHRPICSIEPRKESNGSLSRREPIEINSWVTSRSVYGGSSTVVLSDQRSRTI